MNNKNLLDLHKGLQGIMDIKGSQKFSYAVDKNEKKLMDYQMPLFQEFQKVQEQIDPKLREKYDKAYKELIDKHKAGKPENVNFTPDEETAFYGALNTLRDEHKEFYDKAQNNRKKEEEILNREVKFDIHTISVNDIPDGLTPNQIRSLALLFNDYVEPEKEKEEKDILKIVT